MPTADEMARYGRAGSLSGPGVSASSDHRLVWSEDRWEVGPLAVLAKSPLVSESFGLHNRPLPAGQVWVPTDLATAGGEDVHDDTA